MAYIHYDQKANGATYASLYESYRDGGKVKTRFLESLGRVFDNEELILMYRDIGEYIGIQSENAGYGDAFVKKLTDFFASNYPDLVI